MTAKKIVILPGDGIGQEVTAQAKLVLEAMAKKLGIDLVCEERPFGGASYDLYQTPVTDETLAACKQADAVLLGAVGGPKWDRLDFSLRPERALLKLRKSLELFANLRPAPVFDDFLSSSSLKESVLKGTDMLVVRELTGDLYFGEPRGISQQNGVRVGRNTMQYDENEIRRIAKFGFDCARARSKKLCSVDKANVLETSVLWRAVVEEVAKDYSDVELSHLYVDNAAMQIVKNPRQFDCIVTSNMFGDILSDIAAMITGSIGILPSASLGSKTGLYEPVHGSAPDIAGKNVANPLAAILSVGMLFEYSFLQPEVKKLFYQATRTTLANYRTADVFEQGKALVSTEEMGKAFLKALNL